MNTDDYKALLGFRTAVIRLVNIYNKLDNMPFDTGFGDLLYPSEVHMIEAIQAGKGNTVTALGLHFGITKSAVSQTVTKLISKGFLSKSKDHINKKIVIIAVTEKGEKVFSAHEQFHKRMDESIAALLHELPANHIMEFKQLIEKITNHIEKYVVLPEKIF